MSATKLPTGQAVPRLALTKAEAAEALGVSVDFFEDHIMCELRIVRRGRRRLIPVAELVRWLESSADRALPDAERLLAARAREERVEQPGRLALVARHQVAVAVERDHHARVTHVGAQRLRVDARRDHQRRERVPALVERDRLEPGSLPCPAGAVAQRLRLERDASALTEREPVERPSEPGARRAPIAARPGSGRCVGRRVTSAR